MIGQNVIFVRDSNLTGIKQGDTGKIIDVSFFKCSEGEDPTYRIEHDISGSRGWHFRNDFLIVN